MDAGLIDELEIQNVARKCSRSPRYCISLRQDEVKELKILGTQTRRGFEQQFAGGLVNV